MSNFDVNIDFDISLSPHFNLFGYNVYVNVLRDENRKPKNIDLLPEDVRNSFKDYLYRLGMASLHSSGRARMTVNKRLLVYEHYGCVELVPVVGKIMRLKHDGREIPEELREAWKYICESKSIRRIWNEQDDYLFNISDEIVALARLGYITIEFVG